MRYVRRSCLWLHHRFHPARISTAQCYIAQATLYHRMRSKSSRTQKHCCLPTSSVTTFMTYLQKPQHYPWSVRASRIGLGWASISVRSLACHLSDHAGNVSEAKANPDRELADGDDLITVFVPLFCDDVSGARSKQYQKHINIYSTNWNLPSQYLRQESSVRFISTSPTASGFEQFVPVLELVK